MSVPSVFSWRDRWAVLAIGAVLVIALLAAAVGFLWLPRAHTRAALASMWEAVCSAAGAPAPFRNPGLPAEGARFPSAVVVSAGMLGPADQQAVGRGGTLSLQCTMCHGTRGTSPAGTPHLAGQPAEATYKQLRDFKAGHRASAVMQPLVASLSDRDMRDLAHYYATLVRERPQPVPISYATPRLVRNGDPMRNVGACASCHSPNVARPGTPILDGMNESYVRSQLAAFRSGARANDINAQMRNAVRGLSVAEVDELARYYASR